MAQIIAIDDTGDSRVQRYANLRADLAKPFHAGSFIVEGRLCLRRLIESQHRMISALVQRGKEDEVASWLPESIPVYSLPSAQIEKLVGFHFHRGVLGCGERPAFLSSDQLTFASDRPALALALLGVTESENLGSMMRTAAALGIERLLVGPKTSDPFARRAIRVSMASVLHQKLYSLDQPVAQLNRLRQQNHARIIVTTLDRTATPLDQFEVDDRDSILVLGNEAHGVDQEVEQIATDRVTIPMQLGTDSLNVTVAAAIFLYELLAAGQGKRPPSPG